MLEALESIRGWAVLMSKNGGEMHIARVASVRMQAMIKVL